MASKAEVLRRLREGDLVGVLADVDARRITIKDFNDAWERHQAEQGFWRQLWRLLTGGAT
jgi:hypothetical protein